MPYGTSSFLANPSGFMDANIVIPHHSDIGVDQASGRIHELCRKLGGATGKRHGNNVPVYILKKRRDGDPPESGFFAYWCPYNQNETLNCTLGNGARFMFTATMDGCSFGIGSQTNGVCRVAHANMGSHGGGLHQAGLSVDRSREQQRLTQRNALWNALGDYSAHVINPQDYMSDFDGAMELKSTTFGIHDLGKNWKYYTQRYWRNGNTYFLRGVTEQH
ncbi:MAG: hypothetical protein WBC44_09155 [Planctomycetaceae bacterium]